MRHFIPIVCITALLLSGVCDAESPPGPITLPPFCSKFTPPTCSRLFAPVCATTGDTYSNLCVMCTAMWRGDLSPLTSYVEGRCSDDPNLPGPGPR
ncbi:ovomucoid-like [Patiria miniata]|uniref:Kazal-like domain-containing protein n=1 Tax=Patiria miniata TaxID=46514 RepID=A0A914BRU6_PATMI|nr:ovomucoid-like [Patiria miniata]